MVCRENEVKEMREIRKGDIVARISYQKDILFYVDTILTLTNQEKIAILKGITYRVQADSPIEDLVKIEAKEAKDTIAYLDTLLQNRIDRHEQKQYGKRDFIWKYGRVLHLDGDRRYSFKAERYYKQMGLEAIVRNIRESSQPYMLPNLLQRYKPDVIVITGHDGMIKKGRSYHDIYNYRNSRYFIQSVQQVRKFQEKDIAIFAGACQSYYEGIIEAGADFASSPARILIDFVDPLIVAEKIATAYEKRYVTIDAIEGELRDGKRGIGGIGAYGKGKIVEK